MGTGFAGGLLRCAPCEGSRPFAVSHALHPIPQHQVRGHVGLVQCFPNFLLHLFSLAALLCAAFAAHSADYVSVSAGSAILYDAPSTQAKKLYVVNRYMPFEQIVTLDNWVKVRDRSGGLYWVEKRSLSSKRYVYALIPLVDVRAEPSSNAARVFQVRQQIALEHLDSSGTAWIRVRHQDGNVGYVKSTEVWGS